MGHGLSTVAVGLTHPVITLGIAGGQVRPIDEVPWRDAETVFGTRDESVWAIVCFVVQSDMGQGIVGSRPQ
jgi:hypothetical protein